jgi:hypothetical protein
MGSLLNDIDEFLQFSHKIPAIYQFIQLVAFIMYVAHICGCGFHYLGIVNLDQEVNWLKAYELADSSFRDRYITTFYFAIISMSTVGYGDIGPKSIDERLYVTIMNIVSCGVFGYAVNTIGGIFLDIAKKTSDYKQMK